MSASPTLPPEWFSAFDGTALETRLALSAVLATVDEAQWPHVSYLSAGEILARGEDRISLSVWPSSTTASNMDRTGRAVLHAAAAGAVWETRLELARRPEAKPDGLAIFDGRIVQVRQHAAPYATVESMIVFKLFTPDQTLVRWRDQVTAMQATGDG